MEELRDMELDITDTYMAQDLQHEIMHGIYVSSLAGKLARELNLDGELCHDVETAGLIHDIGKLRISPYIYGRDENTMQIEELRYVRKHSTLGYEIAKKEGYSENICDMILHIFSE